MAQNSVIYWCTVHVMEIGEQTQTNSHLTGCFFMWKMCATYGAVLALFLITFPVPHSPWSSQATAPVLKPMLFFFFIYIANMLHLFKAVGWQSGWGDTTSAQLITEWHAQTWKSHTGTWAVRWCFDDMMIVLFLFQKNSLSFTDHYFSLLCFSFSIRRNQPPAQLSQWMLSQQKASYRYSRCWLHAPVCMWLEKCRQAGSQTVKWAFLKSVKYVRLQYL